MTSKLKSDTARANGAKSRGPKSAATRDKSSRNSLRHGLTSRHMMLLECECAADFQQLCDYYVMIHQPANPAQEDLVDEMIAARWRLRRARTIETVLLDCEMNRNKAEIEKQFVQPDSAVHLAQAFRSLSEESPSLALLSRYESRIHRQHDRAYRALRELQSAQPPAPPATPHSTPEIKNCQTNPEPPTVGLPEVPCQQPLPAKSSQPIPIRKNDRKTLTVRSEDGIAAMEGAFSGPSEDI
jgi:hypothetical protein